MYKDKFLELGYHLAENPDDKCCGLCRYCHTELDDTLTVCDYLAAETDEYYICKYFSN